MKLQAIYVKVQYEKIYNRQLDFYTESPLKED